MTKMDKRPMSWGKYPKNNPGLKKIYWREDDLALDPQKYYLPYGLGRSYGDSCTGDNLTLLGTTRLNRFYEFDEHKGILTCEAGVSFAQINQLIVPKGWFLPVTPGTKFVTVGGALANDVHGKNHHHEGTFGHYVRQFELLRSNGERLICSAQKNTEFFQATIGGLGLTGIVTWVEFGLKKIDSAYIFQEIIQFKSLEEFFEINLQSQKWEYTVAWLDCVATNSKGDALSRGLYIRGRHATQAESQGLGHEKSYPKINVPFDLPGIVLNSYTVKAFNFLFYHRKFGKKVGQIVPYDPFFYPLDSILNWNRIYGSEGFLQYQCVVPLNEGPQAFKAILDLLAKSRRSSFLTVLKTFGDMSSPGLMSFPMEGVTLCVDLSFRRGKTLELLDQLDKLVLKMKGRVYLAKDARMSSHSFKAFYPNWEKFRQFKDPLFNSGLWERVTAD